jgi:hypothetical protein
MKTACRGAFVSILFLILSFSIALAGNNGKGKNKEKGKNWKDDSKGVSTHVDVDVFLTNHRDLIRHHYIDDRRSLPPGLAKRRGDLPPGLEKQLRRNGHLPPGLEKKIYPFPVEVERRLPPLRPGLMRGMIGGSAVIVDKKTSVVLDVFAIL